MQMPGKTIKKIAILQTMDAIKFTDSGRDRATPAPFALKYNYHYPSTARLAFRIKDFPYLRIQELSAAGSRRLPAAQTLDSP